MIRRKTVFIVGAGASAEFGMPIGEKLAAQIGGMLNMRLEQPFGTRLTSGDEQIFWALRSATGAAFPTHQKAAWLVSQGIALSLSIDNFLDNHRDNQELQLCGRVGIAKSILDAERGSNLYVSSSNLYNTLDLRTTEKTWLHRLFKLMQDGVGRRDVATIFDNVIFISFNYDRCIEHFLWWALRLNYGLPENEASSIVSALRVLRPYGSVGTLPWCAKSGEMAVSFGSDDASVVEVAKAIRTYADRLDDDAEGKCREAIVEAKTVAFLGCAYHRQNMEFVCPKSEGGYTRIIGTSLGLSAHNTDIVKSDLERRFKTTRGRSFHLEAVPCDTLIADYSRSFAS